MNVTGNPGRTAGLLYLLMIVLGAFSLYGPTTLIVPGDPGATATNILAAETLYRLTIVSGLTSAVVFLFLARTLYDLLDRVSHRHTALMATMVVISVAVGFALTVNDLAVLAVLRDSHVRAAFDDVQRQAIAMLFVHISGQGVLLAQIFWGLWLFPFGVLVMRSGFLPRILGVLLIFNGAALLIASLCGLLLPTYSDVVNAAMLIPELGELWIMLWLLIKGAKPPDAALTAS